MDDSKLRDLIGDEEHERRMKVARRRAQWELGDPGWAGVLIGAYLYPAADSEALDAEQNDA